MSYWRKSLQNMAEWMDDSWDEVRYRVSELGDPDDDIFIFPYLGFGSRSKIILRGRVLEKMEESLAQENDNRLRNLVRTIRLFKTDEVARARLKVSFGDLEKEIQADTEGFFDVEIETSESLGDEVFTSSGLNCYIPRLKLRRRRKGRS